MTADYLSHLEELRRRLIFSLIFFAVASVVSYFFSHQLLDFLTQPLRRYEAGTQLFFQRPYEAFLTHLKVAALAGLIISLPVFFMQGWLFVAPGLYAHERRTVSFLIFFSVVFFLLGAVFAYLVVIPWGLHFLLSFQTQSLKPLLGIGPYFSFLIGMVLAFGFLFDIPLILVGLVKLGVVRSQTLAKGRKWIIVGIFVLAAILTPSPDPVSQLLLAGPLLLLFEISLAVSRLTERRNPPAHTS